MKVTIVTNIIEDPKKCADLNTRELRNITREHGCIFVSALDELSDISPEEIIRISNKEEYNIAYKSDWHERNIITNNNIINSLSAKIEKLKLLEDRYSGKMDNIVAGSGSIIHLLPRRTYYAALSDYDKKKLSKLMSYREPLIPERRKLLARKDKISKVISMAERDIKKIDKLLSRVKRNLEKIIPGVSIRVESIKTIESRRSIPGYGDLTKGKKAIFGHRAREFLSHRESLDLARSKLDKLLSKQSLIELEISDINTKIKNYNNELESILPGSSRSTIPAIKAGKMKTLKIYDIFPEFTSLPKRTQDEFLRYMRLRNNKAQEVIDSNDKIRIYRTKISDSRPNLAYDFRASAVDLANELYIKSTGSTKPRHIYLIWKTAYFIYTSSHPCICLDKFEIYPDVFYKFIEILSKSPIDKTIYISSIYTPKTIPTGVSIHTVEPR
ncbi:hypothetical protein KAW18_11670 [candidate division WOR-3 bacterium]|nr:hypothetical protein [candidate division WOR-3 bacterium]